MLALVLIAGITEADMPSMSKIEDCVGCMVTWETKFMTEKKVQIMVRLGFSWTCKRFYKCYVDKHWKPNCGWTKKGTNIMINIITVS